MPKFRNFQTNFSGGLLSEGMLGRVDLQQYENGCRVLDNWWPKVAGGMRRRPGSTALNTYNDSLRLESFIFNEDQVYLFAFKTDEIGIYDVDDGTQIDTVDTSSLSMTAQIISELSITQAGDILFFAHDSQKTQMVRRTSATTFVLEDYDFDVPPGAESDGRAMPFIKYADGDTTLFCNAYQQGTAVTVTASGAYFTADHVDTLIRYRGKQIFIDTVTSPPSTTASGTIVEDLDRSCILTFNATVDVPMDYDIDEICVGKTSGIKGICVAKTNTTVTLAMIGGIFPAGSTEEVEGLTSGNVCTIVTESTINPAAINDWDEQAFSDFNGWPSVIEFHSQRLWLAGSSSLPAHIFGSRVAAFFNFDAGDGLPADSIQAVISSKSVKTIHDVVSGRHLQLFTDGGEFYAPQSEDLPLVPETFDLLKQTNYGSKRYIEPKIFDESTLYVQAQGNAIREYIWIANQRGYSSDAVSLIAEEYLADIQEVDVLYGGYDRPEQLAFFLTGAGDIIWYHAARAEGIRSWGRWTTQGSYKSMTVVQDKLFAIVDRDNISGTDQIIERFDMHMTVDSGLTKVSASLTPVTEFLGAATHLEDVEVEIVVSLNPDGSGSVGGFGVSDQALTADYYLGSTTVGNGANAGDVSITGLGVADVTNMVIGLPYTQELETMPIEVKDQTGVTAGMPKRIVSSDIFMASTLAIALNGNRITTKAAPITLGEVPVPVTGNRKFYLLGYSERPTLTITNNIPLPCEALAVSGEVEY